jgi:S1-C subfamily serine protease
MAAEPQPKNRWVYVSIALIVILIAQIGFFSYVLIDVQRNVSDLHNEQVSMYSDFTALKLSIEGLRSQLGQLQGPTVQPTTVFTPVQIYDLSEDSVVQVATKKRTFLGLEPFSSGSGFVYNKDGYIITNNHVIEDADAIEVTFSDGTIVQAEFVGADPYSDLAVIWVDRPPDLLDPLPLGRSSELLVGESVLAIGNPFGLSNSMTRGIVSQLGRDLDAPGNYKIIDVVQVDAAINPGNSGGPLMNMRGEVVGVNTAIIPGSIGVGFAIPSDTVSREISQLIQTGQYVHPWIGISSVDLDPDIARSMDLDVTKGTVVVGVIADSPAEKAGIKAGDVIVGVDGIAIRKLIDLLVYIERNKRPGDTVTLELIRNGDRLTVDVTLGARPSL